MKTRRNETCPCGSGLKYKKCCLGKSKDEQFFEAVLESDRLARKTYRIKRCLHPSQEECNGKIVRAHAIQNNRIINRLAVGGCVITLDGNSHLFFQDSQVRGRREATTFTGFCAYHDKVVFQNIEDLDFSATLKQIFLLTYRTMAWHVHKKEEQIKAKDIQFENMAKKGYDIKQSTEYHLFQKGFEQAIRDNDNEKRMFDTLLLSEEYDRLSSCIWELPYELDVALSMMHELEHDISGKTINNLELDDSVKKIYLNILPAKSKSYCIWSWLEENDEVYERFTDQFMALDILNRENYLNNQLPRWTDALIISPRLWDQWGKSIQEALITHANLDFIYRSMEQQKQSYKYEYMETPWNFFSCTN